MSPRDLSITPSIPFQAAADLFKRHTELEKLWDAYSTSSAANADDVAIEGIVGILLEWESIRTPELVDALATTRPSLRIEGLEFNTSPEATAPEDPDYDPDQA